MTVWRTLDLETVSVSPVKGPWMFRAATLDVELSDGSRLLVKTSRPELVLAAPARATEEAH